MIELEYGTTRIGTFSVVPGLCDFLSFSHATVRCRARNVAVDASMSTTGANSCVYIINTNHFNPGDILDVDIYYKNKSGRIDVQNVYKICRVLNSI